MPSIAADGGSIVAVSDAGRRIHVVAGIIWNQQRTQLLVSRRPDHLHKGGYWEFPGGKVDAGESEQQALARELFEELNIHADGFEHFQTIEFDYPEKQVRLAFYHVFQVDGQICGKLQQEWRWLPVQDLSSYRFPEANQPVIDALVKML